MNRLPASDNIGLPPRRRSPGRPKRWSDLTLRQNRPNLLQEEEEEKVYILNVGLPVEVLKSFLCSLNVILKFLFVLPM